MLYMLTFFQKYIKLYIIKTQLGEKFLAKAEYRSSIRSKNLIKKALAKLINEKDLNKITVSDIIREADISRGTFYAHYSDIQSVLNQIRDEELNNLFTFVENFFEKEQKNDLNDFIFAVCEYMNANLEYYQLLAVSNLADQFIEKLYLHYYEPLKNIFLLRDPSQKDIVFDTYLIFIGSGIKNVLISWLSGNIVANSREISDILCALIYSCRKFYDEMQ